GKKALTHTPPETWSIVQLGPGTPSAAAAGASGTPAPGTGAADKHQLNVEAIEVRVDPRAEWAQIFNEAWRLNRDYFYATNYHGVDWPAMRAKYEAFVPELATPDDLYRVIRWMLSELAVGHSCTQRGERLAEQTPLPGVLR